MKKLLQFTLLALALLSVMSSCNQLFDVPPRDIYSPIELGTATASYALSPYKYLNVHGDTTSEGIKNSAVRFAIKDTTLKYGAVLFYDSLSAHNLVKNGLLAGVPEFYPAGRDRKPSEKTVNLKIDPLKGQFQYIVPVGYNKDSTRIYTAKGYVRIKISPWTRIKDLEFYSTLQYRVKLFQGNGKLGYLKYDQLQIYSYELDPSSYKWISKSNFAANVCKGGCPSRSGSSIPIEKDVVTFVENAYFYNKQYHFIVNTYALSDLPFRYRIGEVLTDQNLAFSGHQELAYSTQPLSFYASDFQRDTLRFLYERPNVTTRPNPLNNNPIDYTVPSGGFRPPAGSYTIWPVSESLVDPTISLFIGQKLVINSGVSPSRFTVFDLSKGQFKNVGTANFTGVWTPAAPRLITIADGNQAYLVNSNLNLYRVTVKPDNTPVFQNFYSEWFPGNSANAISQGILYQNKLLFLVNDYQLWEFDPNQLTIDFSRPGAVTIVSL